MFFKTVSSDFFLSMVYMLCKLGFFVSGYELLLEFRLVISDKAFRDIFSFYSIPFTRLANQLESLNSLACPFTVENYSFSSFWTVRVLCFERGLALTCSAPASKWKRLRRSFIRLLLLCMCIFR